ncbi:hypothetical protein V6N13_071436 [Hibiscus sabdariffa]
MPRYYCDYCDTYLTHDSPSVRKQHNAGYKHKANVRTYYQQFEEQQTQSLIDQRIKEHLEAPTSCYALPRGAPLPMVPGIRPPVLPRPVLGAPGYAPVPGMPPMIAPPGAPSLPGQVNNLQQPPTLTPPSTVPGTATTPTSSNGAPTMATPAPYQTNPTAPAGGGLENFNASAQPSEAKQ